jgi:hypothetical protein
MSSTIDIPLTGSFVMLSEGQKGICITAEEVRRTQNATSLSLMPIRHDAGTIRFVWRSDTKRVRNVLERDAVRDVLALLRRGLLKVQG